LQVLHQGFYHPFKHSTFYPLLKSAVAGLIGSESLWYILPRCARSHYPQDTFQYFPFIAPWATPAITSAFSFRHQILYLFPLFITYLHPSKLLSLSIYEIASSNILHHFFDMYDNEIFDNHYDLFEGEKTDLKHIAATVMGREMKKIAQRNEKLYDRIQEILHINTTNLVDSPIGLIMTEHFDNTVEENIILLQHLRRGITE
jgi:hypothetical protein